MRLIQTIIYFSVILSLVSALSGCESAKDSDATRGAGDAAGQATDGATTADSDSAADANTSTTADGDNAADTANGAGDASDDATAGGVCPPVGTFGGGIGEATPALTWLDCDGNAYDVRSLCEAEAVWIVLFAGWCPKCRAFAGQANAFAAQFNDAPPNAFAGFVLVTETANYERPDAAYCAEVRAQYGLEVPVLYEPTGETQRALGVSNNDVHVVLARGNVVTFKKQYTTPEDVAAAIRALLP
jgi:thiol-disulfide isomerase/thioredoxin